jgi:hypothetical protein
LEQLLSQGLDVVILSIGQAGKRGYCCCCVKINLINIYTDADNGAVDFTAF